MLNLTCEDGGVPVEVNQYRERKIEKNVINIITMSLQMNVQLTNPTFICDDFLLRFLEMNQFLMNHFLNQNADYLLWIFENWFPVRNNCDHEALANLANISLAQINIGLQWMAVLSFSGLVIWSP